MVRITWSIAWEFLSLSTAGKCSAVKVLVTIPLSSFVIPNKILCSKSFLTMCFFKVTHPPSHFFAWYNTKTPNTGHQSVSQSFYKHLAGWRGAHLGSSAGRARPLGLYSPAHTWFSRGALGPQGLFSCCPYRLLWQLPSSSGSSAPQRLTQNPVLQAIQSMKWKMMLSRTPAKMKTGSCQSLCPSFSMSVFKNIVTSTQYKIRIWVGRSIPP